MICVLATLLYVVYGQTNDTPLLGYSYTGTGKPGISGQEFMAVMAHLDVQRILLELAAAPRNQAFLDAALKGTGITPEFMRTLRLIRRKGDEYVLGFMLFTNADLDKIRAVAEIEGKSLADAVLSQRSEIQGILTKYVHPRVDLKEIAYFILGYCSLDNDGLNLVGSKGYLAVPGKDAYIPSAHQIGGGGSVRGLYWGSHSMHKEIALTSFGDHYSVPRHALPDLLWPLKESLQGMNAPETLKSDLVDAAEALILRRAGMIMLALRDGDKTDKQLAEAANLTGEETAKLLGLLSRLSYVRNADGLYRAIIPVLDERDAPMVRELRILGRKVMIKWLEEGYKRLTVELGDLSSVRYGVPLSEGFWDIWHYVFGIANRELVAAGLFADPYGADRIYKGFIPAVYRLDVVQGPF